MARNLYDLSYDLTALTLVLGLSLLGLSSCSSSKTSSVNSRDPGIEQESILNRIEPDSTGIPITSRPSRISKPDTVLTVPVSVDTLLNNMTLEEKIGQLFFIGAFGNYKSDDDEVYRDLISRVKEYHVGGLIFFTGTVYGQVVLTNKLQSVSKIPLWITQDMEYGAAMRIRDATRFTPAMGIAATQNPDYAYWVGKITAQEAGALGVHQIFAPVLDVNNNPDNPVINVRSFSGNPETVATFGNRFIEGVKSEGLIPTAKHFPGHGDTGTDSHLALPIVNYDYSRLDSVELVPFRSAVENGVPSIMSAHISFPKLSDTPDIPGTLDKSILNRILIDSLNFDGMVVTDGLDMNGIASHFSPGKAVVRALQAGADMMLLSPDAVTAINEVKIAVKNGAISESRIERSARKLLTWKKEQGLFEERMVDIDKLSSMVNMRDHRLIADEISRESITLLRNKNQILPIRPADFPKLLVISVADDETGLTGTSLARGIRNYHPDVTFRVFDKRSGKEEREKILKEAKEADLIIIGSFIFVRSARPVQISKEQLRFLNKLPSEKPTALIAFGNPYVVHDLPETDVQLLAWSANNDQVRNTVPALFGGSKISGRLPITIPEMYPHGHGIDLPQTTLRFDEPETVGLCFDSLQKVDRIMNNAIFDSTFPGGVVTVVKDGVIAFREGYGYHTYQKLERVEPADIYDLASLTKIVATTAATMKLVDEGKLSLDDNISEYIPEFKQGAKNKITIRNFLLHNSGLPPFRVYVDSLKKEEAILNAIKNEPLTYPPGSKYVYSDLGFILLAEIIEQVTGTTLDNYMRSNFYYPLGMNSTFFNPGRRGRWFKKRIPPTEIDTVYRNKIVHAEVHDERAYYLNGVAGHAGLFSSAQDLAIYAQMLMNEGSYGGKQYVSSEIVNTFTRRQSAGSDRGYGFDHKSEGFSSAGSLTSVATYGHTGFTGTSMWIDPKRDLAIIILTNRTYPQRSYGKNISRVRAAVADAVISSIIE